MRVIVQLEPPDAQAQLAQWRLDNAQALEVVPSESIKIDMGRASCGDFVRVSVEESYADYFTAEPAAE